MQEKRRQAAALQAKSRAEAQLRQRRAPQCCAPTAWRRGQARMALPPLFGGLLGPTALGGRVEGVLEAHVTDLFQFAFLEAHAGGVGIFAAERRVE